MRSTNQGKMILAGLGLLLAAPGSVAAMPSSTPTVLRGASDMVRPAPVLMAQGSCSSAARQAAAESGGQVLSVSVSQQGGRTVCVVTVLVPGRDGARPRRVTVTVPQ